MGAKRLPKWFKEANARRAGLIHKQVRGTISREEAVELEVLQTVIGREVERVHPLKPSLRKANRLLKKLESKIANP